MSENHRGFLTYLQSGVFTEDFITDYKYWCFREFRHWTLFIDFDEFYNRCWEELLTKFKKKPFDPKVAEFQTYVISTAHETAQRIWVGNKRYVKHPEVDCDDPVVSNSVSISDCYFSIFNPLKQFCEHLEIDVDVEGVESDYQENVKSIPTMAIDWWKLKYEQGAYEC